MPGKVIAITGANGGLGRALSQRFASEGEQVVMLGRSMDKLKPVADAIGAAALPVECDVTSAESVRAAFATIARTHPKLDVLINNAAIFQPFLIEEASDDEIIRGVMTNLAGPMLCARSAIPMMGKGGLIVNVSTESVALQFPHLIVYQATKTGMEKFSIELNKELWDKGIRATVVRAGQMMGEGMSAQMDPVKAMAFMQAAMANGLKLAERGISPYQSATQVFRNLIDMPADTHVEIVAYQGRRTD
jgi:meso-butanediol dehydrogenase/(S,S)-butanediol dehydrogenase/diacetyl reductase